MRSLLFGAASAARIWDPRLRTSDTRNIATTIPIPMPAPPAPPSPPPPPPPPPLATTINPIDTSKTLSRLHPTIPPPLPPPLSSAPFSQPTHPSQTSLAPVLLSSSRNLLHDAMDDATDDLSAVVETPAGSPDHERVQLETLPPLTSLPRPVMLSRSRLSPPSSSINSSPRRPCRAGTGIPTDALYGSRFGTQFSASDFDPRDSVRDRSARDEFEEGFLNVLPGDPNVDLISQHLENVDFRQLSDYEEVLSEDAADASRGEEAARRADARRRGEGSDEEKEGEEARREKAERRERRASTVRSNWRRIPSEVGCEGCEGCARLYEENRSLRRQLDELEFEVASGVLHNPADGFEAPTVMTTVPTIPQIRIANQRRKKRWGGKLRMASSNSVTGGRAKQSERVRLQSEVKALTVTTEYLWRKLNKAEMELRKYRLKDLRNRMKISAVTARHQQKPTEGDVKP